MAKGFFPGPEDLIVCFLLVCLCSCTTHSPQGDRQPLKDLSLSSLHMFQTLISPADGDRCMMLPSCSAYGEEAILKHGFFMGWIMACDRLMRCGHDELYHSEVLMLGGQSYCYDPIENNDFWWGDEHP
ncbi:MAG: membrane protein insertion efficiency factor YidD [Proteobacteria bacterium]|nr:membrane protein insertion efficiency factor YidD [Pseudomonadota bacterium]